MKLAVFLKLSNKGAKDFIIPLVNLQYINLISIFRNEPITEFEKVDNNFSIINSQKILYKEANKFIIAIKKITKEYKVIIGFYEVPHGLFAVIIGKIKKIPSVVCFLSNIDYKKVRKGFRLWLTLWILKNANYITVTGLNSQNQLIKKGIKENKIYVLPNPVNINEFEPNFSEKEFDLITMTNLLPEKKVDLFINMVAEYKKMNPDVKAAIAGKGPEENRLHDLIINLGLESNIKLVGFVESSSHFLNSGKIFILTSETEGLPRTILESMACGVPCVSVNVGDVEDVIKNGINGFILSENNIYDDFNTKIFNLLSNFDLYRKFSINSMEIVQNNYSFDSVSKFWNYFFIKNELLK